VSRAHRGFYRPEGVLDEATPELDRVEQAGRLTLTSRALEKAVTPNTVAMLIEPIQGEAGVIIPPAGYLRRAREICTRENVILILDEIQTSLGPTGKLLAEEHEGVEADLTLIGKALAGGFYPVSTVLSNNEVLGVLKPGEHGSTFGGNPLACAVARAALRVLVEEDMIGNAARIGERLQSNLAAIASSKVKDVRGRGLMIAVELYPDAGGARAICVDLMRRGLLCKETHEHTIRIAPPLILTADQADWIAEQFELALGAYPDDPFELQGAPAFGVGALFHAPCRFAPGMRSWPGPARGRAETDCLFIFNRTLWVSVRRGIAF
jgi:acetylornithine/succinyldiaminopimelate/putrescine aminotransferase